MGEPAATRRAARPPPRSLRCSWRLPPRPFGPIKIGAQARTQSTGTSIGCTDRPAGLGLHALVVQGYGGVYGCRVISGLGTPRPRDIYVGLYFSAARMCLRELATIYELIAGLHVI